MDNLKRVLFMNDSSLDNHYGCELASQILKQLIRKYAIISKNLPIGFNWDKEDLYTADSVIINGEGTLHNNSYRVDNIYSLARYAKNLGKRVCLINSVLQDLPDWFDLSTFDYITVRERCSYDYATTVKEYNKKNLEIVPDACFYKLVKEVTKVEKKIIITDSVVKEVSSYLNQLADLFKKDEIKIEIIPFIRDTILDNYETILNKFNQASMVISGRFHANCFAIMTRTPVFSLPSNTFKNQGIMLDFGLKDYFFDNTEDFHTYIRSENPFKKLYKVKFESEPIQKRIENSIKKAIKIKEALTVEK